MAAMGRITTARGVIGVDDTGGGTRTPLIFLHGVGSDKSVWWPQLGHFGGTRRTVAFDYPGYGESQFADDATRDDFAFAILAAMDSLDILRAHICGLSLGGVVALALHHAEPDRCASLILAANFAIHPDGRAIYDRSVAASDDMAAMASARVPALVAAGTDPALCGMLIAKMAAIDPAAFRLGARAVWLADQRDRLAAIAVPTLVIVGADDRIIPPALSGALAMAIAGAENVEIAGAGHLANIDRPAAFNTAIDRFLARIDQ